MSFFYYVFFSGNGVNGRFVYVRRKFEVEFGKNNYIEVIVDN